MATKEKYLSIADIVSAVSFILLLYYAAVGMVIMGYDNQLVIALGILLFLAGLICMFFAIKAKKASNDFHRWAVVKYCMLGLTAAIAVACLPFAVRGLNFFSETESMQKAAREDVETISNMLDNFSIKETQRLVNTVQGLDTYVDFRPTGCDSQLLNFIATDVMHGQNGSLSHIAVNEYKNSIATIIANGTANHNQGNILADYRSRLLDCTRAVNDWEFWTVGDLATDLSILADTVGIKLTGISANLNLPIVHTDNASFYTMSPSPSVIYDGTATRLKDSFDGIEAIKPRSLLFAALLVFGYFFSFILSYSSRKAPSKKMILSQNQGIPL